MFLNSYDRICIDVSQVLHNRFLKMLYQLEAPA